MEIFLCLLTEAERSEKLYAVEEITKWLQKFNYISLAN
jgi:hypothetical protein